MGISIASNNFDLTGARELSVYLQSIREDERTRIAREIHDELGQQLTGLKFETYLLKKLVATKDIVVQDKLACVVTLIDEAIKSVGRISTKLRPCFPDNLGLLSALKCHGQEFEMRTGIPVQFFSTQNDLKMEENQLINIFRVYQETLTNIARHAGATKVFTALIQNGNYTSLITSDNGRGFDLNEVKMKNPWGLIGMKERALMLNGNLAIKSSRSGGTTVILKVPYAPGDQ
jgi:signal transduction histidine kinase